MANEILSEIGKNAVCSVSSANIRNAPTTFGGSANIIAQAQKGDIIGRINYVEYKVDGPWLQIQFRTKQNPTDITGWARWDVTTLKDKYDKSGNLIVKSTGTTTTPKTTTSNNKPDTTPPPADKNAGYGALLGALLLVVGISALLK